MQIQMQIHRLYSPLYIFFYLIATSEDALIIMDCAWNLTHSWVAQKNISSLMQEKTPIHQDLQPVRWILVSDNILRLKNLTDNYLLHRPKNGAHLHVIVPRGGEVVHIVKNQHIDAIMRLWLDIFLISESHTCVFARSGFPEFACRMSERRAQHAGEYNEFTSSVDKRRFQQWRHEMHCNDWLMPASDKGFIPQSPKKKKRRGKQH